MLQKFMVSLMMVGMLAMGAVQLVAGDSDGTTSNLAICDVTEENCCPSTYAGQTFLWCLKFNNYRNVECRYTNNVVYNPPCN